MRRRKMCIGFSSSLIPVTAGPFRSFAIELDNSKSHTALGERTGEGKSSFIQQYSLPSVSFTILDRLLPCLASSPSRSPSTSLSLVDLSCERARRSRRR